MKKMVKILPIIMTVLMVFMAVSPVFANAMVGGVNINPNKSNATGITGITDKILGVIQVIGSVVAVGVLMVIGIKYMMGSAEEKAEYKKSFLPLIIGIILVVAATSVASFIFGIVE